MSDHYDVIVAGAGIGGLCAALRARKKAHLLPSSKKPKQSADPQPHRAAPSGVQKT